MTEGNFGVCGKLHWLFFLVPFLELHLVFSCFCHFPHQCSPVPEPFCACSIPYHESDPTEVVDEADFPLAGGRLVAALALAAPASARLERVDVHRQVDAVVADAVRSAQNQLQNTGRRREAALRAFFFFFFENEDKRVIMNAIGEILREQLKHTNGQINGWAIMGQM